MRTGVLDHVDDQGAVYHVTWREGAPHRGRPLVEIVDVFPRPWAFSVEALHARIDSRVTPHDSPHFVPPKRDGYTLEWIYDSDDDDSAADSEDESESEDGEVGEDGRVCVVWGNCAVHTEGHRDLDRMLEHNLRDEVDKSEPKLMRKLMHILESCDRGTVYLWKTTLRVVHTKHEATRMEYAALMLEWRRAAEATYGDELEQVRRRVAWPGVAFMDTLRLDRRVMMPILHRLQTMEV